jgi:hypothetical protein
MQSLVLTRYVKIKMGEKVDSDAKKKKFEFIFNLSCLLTVSDLRCCDQTTTERITCTVNRATLKHYKAKINKTPLNGTLKMQARIVLQVSSLSIRL